MNCEHNVFSATVNAIKVYGCHQLATAREYAATGAVAVHLHYIITPRAPKCFVRDVKAGYPIAHVFSSDAVLLRDLAHKCGVRVIVIEHQGTVRQHVDMCGRPLRRLLEMAGSDIEDHRVAAIDQAW